MPIPNARLRCGAKVLKVPNSLGVPGKSASGFSYSALMSKGPFLGGHFRQTRNASAEPLYTCKSTLASPSCRKTKPSSALKKVLGCAFHEVVVGKLSTCTTSGRTTHAANAKCNHQTMTNLATALPALRGCTSKTCEQWRAIEQRNPIEGQHLGDVHRGARRENHSRLVPRRLTVGGSEAAAAPSRYS